MASLDRMDTEAEYNSSDGESSDEENPQQLQDKARRLALALGQKWDAAVARKRLAINKDDLPGARRNTAELMADLRRLRQMTRSATDSSSSSIGVGAAEAGADSRELGRR